VPTGLTHISLDNYVADCFWNALATRGIYEQYLYPKMTDDQKAFVVPAGAPQAGGVKGVFDPLSIFLPPSIRF
jgi:hypothetical protein